MSDSTWRGRAFLLSFLGAGLFVVLSTLAMLAYSGGTYSEPGASGYRFFQNFFSDLGLTVAYNGQPNVAPRGLFIASLFAAGISLALYFVAAAGLFRERRLTYWLALSGTLAGVTSALAFIGIGLAPADRLLTLHANLVLLAFSSLLVAAALYVPPMLLSLTYPRRYVIVTAVFTALLIAYVWLMMSVPAAGTERGRSIQILGQKIIVYAAVVAVALQTYGSWRYVSRVRGPSSKPSPGEAGELSIVGPTG